MQVLAASYSSTEQGCQAFIEAAGGVDANLLDDRPSSTFECAVNVSSADVTFAQDAAVNATLTSRIFACEDPSDLRANSSAMVRSRRCWPSCSSYARAPCMRNSVATRRMVPWVMDPPQHGPGTAARLSSAQ